MATLHMMVGIQGSGKSTYSKKLSRLYGYKIISSDEVRKANPTLDEVFVFPEVYRQCAESLKIGNDVIFDATCITPAVRKKHLDAIKNIYDLFKVKIYFVDTDVEICKRRVDIRNKLENEIFIPLDVIESYSKNIIPPSIDEGFDEIVVLKNYEEELVYE